MTSHADPAASWVELIGHAQLRVHSGGRTLLMDPWFNEPIDGNATYHWPPLVHSLDELVRSTDYIWISHIHPDHFDPATLQRFPENVPIYIGEYANKAFRDRLRALGREVREVPFQQETLLPGSDIAICLLESDYDESAAYDSGIVVRTPAFTLLNNNDCFLADGKYQWVAERYRIDYAFLGYSPASYYPVCFEFEPAEKARRLALNAERRYEDFMKVARLLRPRLSVPFAMGIRFLHPDMVWQNVQFNRSQEAVRRARAEGLAAEALWPGDRLSGDGGLQRRSPDMDEQAEDVALAAHAARMAEHAAAVWAAETPARPGLADAFRKFLLALWTQSGHLFPDLRGRVIAYRLVGDQAAEFHLDFSRPAGEEAGPGIPDDFDMRYTYPDKLLQRRLDGEIDWDELHFSNRVSVLQNRYAADFYAMLRHEENSRSE